MTKPKVKKVTLPIYTKAGAKKLAALIADGWVIISEHKRGMLEFKPGQVDYVLTKSE